mmetsp:Transcript_6988/g.18861  ORF Transcript_6988/g.18861 Transcript_6988/m.18861 type:complete len:381 (-) Transcript_6988:294-1436(-)
MLRKSGRVHPPRRPLSVLMLVLAQLCPRHSEVQHFDLVVGAPHIPPAARVAVHAAHLDLHRRAEVEQPRPAAAEDGELLLGPVQVALAAPPMLLGGYAVVDQEHVVRPQDYHEQRGPASRHGDGYQDARDDTVQVDRVEVFAVVVVHQRPNEVPQQKRDHHQREAGHGGRETDEEKVIPLPNAVVHVGAVVVETQHAVVAIRAVRGPRRPNNLAGGAPPVAVVAQLLRHHHLGRPAAERVLLHVHNAPKDVVAQLLPQLLRNTSGLDNLTPRNDAGVREAGAQQEHHGEEEEETRDEDHRGVHPGPVVRQRQPEEEPRGRQDAGPRGVVLGRQGRARGPVHDVMILHTSDAASTQVLPAAPGQAPRGSAAVAAAPRHAEA